MRITAALISLAAAGLLLTSCATSGDTPGETGDDTGDPSAVFAEETLWGAPGAEASGSGEPWLSLTPSSSDGGEYAGNDGCNGFSGMYTVNGATIELGDGVMTLIACPDLDPWLTSARSAELSGNELVFVDEEGTEIGTLPRNEG